jgi:hypothetical protein
VIGAALISEDAFAMMLRPSLSAASPGHSISGSDMGLSPWNRFATHGLLLRYIAGGGGRYTRKWPPSRVFVGFNRQYV